MHDSRALIEQSRQLIAIARDVVERSRRIRAQVHSSSRRSRSLVTAAAARGILATAAKGSRDGNR